jgi:hypothetical protein
MIKKNLIWILVDILGDVSISFVEIQFLARFLNDKLPLLLTLLGFRCTLSSMSLALSPLTHAFRNFVDFVFGAPSSSDNNKVCMLLGC